MRKNRIAVFSLILLSLFFGLYTGEKIFFIVFAMLALLVVSAFIMGLWILIGFKYLQTIEPSTVEKGESATLKIEIHNDRPFIYPYIKVNIKTPKEVIGGYEREYVLSLLPFKHEVIKESFPCPLRGKYPIGITSVQVQDPFGLFTFNIDLSKKPYYRQLYLMIFPRILEIPLLPLLFVEMDEVQSSKLRQTEESSSVSDIRQYEYGDPLKKIHWKISSKYQEMYVKQYETSSRPKTLVFLETTPYPVGGIVRHELEDQLIECTISIINHMLQRYISTELILYNRDRLRLRGQGPQDLSIFYDTLSLLSFDGNLPLKQILTLEEAGLDNNYNIVLITYSLDYDLFNYICTFKELGFYPILFLIEHSLYRDMNMTNMITQLNDIDIPAYTISTGERIDDVLEDLI